MHQETLFCVRRSWYWFNNVCVSSVCFAAMTLGGTVDILATDDPDVVAEEHEELQIYEKHNNLLHGSKRKRYTCS